MEYNLLPFLQYLNSGDWSDNPIVICSTDEILANDLKQLIKQRYQQMGYRVRAHNSDIDFSSTASAAQPSLFAERFCDIYTLPAKKATVAQKKWCAQILATASSEEIPVIIIQQSYSQLRREAFMKEQKSLIKVAVYPLSSQQFTPWLKSRSQMHGLVIAGQPLVRLTQLCEGNVLKAIQDLEKLATLFPKANITQQHLNALGDSALHQYVFELIDCVYSGNISQLQKILSYMQDHQSEPTLVLWQINQELTFLKRLSNEPKEVVLKQYKNFKIQKSDIASLHQYLEKNDGFLKAAQTQHVLDKLFKSSRRDLFWQLLSQFLCQLCTRSSLEPIDVLHFDRAS